MKEIKLIETWGDGIEFLTDIKDFINSKDKKILDIQYSVANSEEYDQVGHSALIIFEDKKDSRNGLRPVEVKIYCEEGVGFDKRKVRKIVKGYFHQFMSFVDEEREALVAHAIVELEDGTVREVTPTDIKFLDRE